MLQSRQNKLVLCATANSLLAGLWRGGKLQSNQSFANDEAGHQAFSKFLQQYPEAPVHLIVDAAEESYRLESLPHTTGHAQRALVARKLNQYCRGLNYRTAHFIDRDQDKRRDDNFLFAALNNDDFLKNWVAVIQAAKAPLVGIYLLSMLSQVLARQLQLMAPHILLCEKLSSGLRQTYLHHGQLYLSRLISNVPTNADQLEYFYLEETEKTWRYLMSQRFISHETPLKLVLLSTDGTTQQMSQAINQERNWACSDISLAALIMNLGLPTNLVQQMPELLHMHLLANGHLVDNLAPESLTKNFQFARVKQAIKISTVALGVLGLVATGWMLKQGLDNKTALNQAMQDTVTQQHRYDEASKNFPITPISANDLRIAVALDKTIAGYPKSPRRLMQVVSAALEQSSPGTLVNIQLDKLRWVLSHDRHLQDEDKLAPLPASNHPQTDIVITAPTDPSTLNEIAFVTAEITGFTGNYREVINSVNRFVANIKADSRVATVEVLQEPVNASSFVDLQGSTTDEPSTQKQPAFFKLKVMLKPADMPPETLAEVQ